MLVLATVSLLSALLCVAIIAARFSWDYNEQGTYFDEQSGTTYSDSAIVGYSALAILFFVIAAFLFATFRKYKAVNER